MPAALRLRRPTVDPTRITYISLSEAHDFFNKALFEGQLPHCLLTMRRHAKARAHFSSQRFSSRAGGEATRRDCARRDPVQQLLGQGKSQCPGA
jgi:hypothetical protein